MSMFADYNNVVLEEKRKLFSSRLETVKNAPNKVMEKYYGDVEFITNILREVEDEIAERILLGVWE